MKRIFCLLSIVICFLDSHAQVREVTQDWTGFIQAIDASFVKKKIKIRVSASVKVITDDPNGSATLWLYVLGKENKNLFYNGMEDRKITANEWRTYVIEGEVTENPAKIQFGGFCYKRGKFYFDNFEVFIKEGDAEFRKVNLNNADFESLVVENKIPHWNEGWHTNYNERVKGYSISSDGDHVSGSYALLIEGKNVTKDSTYLIGPVNGFTPQIGALVSMLRNMTSRVEKDVFTLTQKELDHLMDDKSNSIGALIMHLIAAEVYFQVRTFEGRDFNEEEKKKWQIPFDLGEEARKTIKGHDVEYYLAIFREVRKKTLEEFSKRNDEWLFQTQPDDPTTNNYFTWFHVTEHQSSHLGQIRIIKKRLPERKEKLPVETIEADH